MYHSTVIRSAQLQDAHAIMPLVEQLGYPTDLETLTKRIQIYLESPSDTSLFVAQSDNRIVGLIALAIFENFVTPTTNRTCRITALVVDNTCRKQGIGRLLIQQAEQWASENQAGIVELTSGTRRAQDGAHDFYAKLGYANDGPFSKLFLRKKIV